MTLATAFAATGRRKSSVARVRIALGTGKIEINGPDAGEFIAERGELEVMGGEQGVGAVVAGKVFGAGPGQ